MDERQIIPIPRRDMLWQHISLLAMQRRGAPLGIDFEPSMPEDLVELGVPLALVEPLAARHNELMSPVVNGTPMELRNERLSRWNGALSMLADLTGVSEDVRRELDIPVGQS